MTKKLPLLLAALALSLPALAAPSVPSNEVLDADLAAVLAGLGARPVTISDHARARVRAQLERRLQKPTLRETWQRKKAAWPVIARELKARGLPEEVGYLAWAESGFRADLPATSMGSRGVWQFIPKTARAYGLTVDEHVDDRLDLAKETHAASEYLSKLLGEFGKDSPLLALAAYNAGEHAIHKILDGLAAKDGGQKPEHRDFFWLTERKLLPDEASEYVPAILAAALIGTHPEKYGLE